MPDEVTLIATTAMGLDSIVAAEVKNLGYDVQVENGKVVFSARVSAIPRASMWVRSADRVNVRVGQFKASSFYDLFEAKKALPWEYYIPEEGKFPVSGKSHKSTLY